MESRAAVFTGSESVMQSDACMHFFRRDQWCFTVATSFWESLSFLWIVAGDEK